MTEEQRLFGEFKTLEIREVLFPEDSFENYQTQIDLNWQRFKEGHPAATRDQKIRVAALKGEGNSLVVYLSAGIDFSHVLFSEKLRVEQNLPSTPMETFYEESGVYYSRVPYANAAAVAGIVLLNPNKSLDLQDEDVRVLFSVRSSRQATDSNTLSLMVNGYVDAGLIDNHIFKENLFREAKEEAYINRNEFLNVAFIGPAQMRGKSCDFVWLLESSLSFEEWERRWRENGGQEESAGILALAVKDLEKLFVENVRNKLVIEHGLISAETRSLVESSGLSLNPLVQSFKPNIMRK